jgi:hypothetical protein
MPAIHKWWENRPEEIYWLEVTRRPDIGAKFEGTSNERAWRRVLELLLS